MEGLGASPIHSYSTEGVQYFYAPRYLSDAQKSCKRLTGQGDQNSNLKSLGNLAFEKGPAKIKTLGGLLNLLAFQTYKMARKV